MKKEILIVISIVIVIIVLFLFINKKNNDKIQYEQKGDSIVIYKDKSVIKEIDSKEKYKLKLMELDSNYNNILKDEDSVVPE